MIPRTFSFGEARILIALAVTFLAVACSSSKLGVLHKEEPEVISPEPLSSEAWKDLQEKFRELVSKADFNRADECLFQAAAQKLTRAQREEIRQLRYDLRKTSFLHHNPLLFRMLAPRKIYTFGEEIRVHCEIENLSDQAVSIPASGGLSWLPWSEKRQSMILAKIDISDLRVVQGTRSGGEWSEVLELDRTEVIKPGLSFRKDLILKLPPVKDVIYRRLILEAELIPGGLQTGPFDWGMIRFTFSPITLHVFQEQDRALAMDPEGGLARGIANRDGRLIVLSSILLGDELRWSAMDQIIGVLPELMPEHALAVTHALQWITGCNLGSDINRWLDWWDINRDAWRAPSTAFLEGVGHEDKVRDGLTRNMETCGTSAGPVPFWMAAVLFGGSGALPLPESEEDGNKASRREDRAQYAYEAIRQGLDDLYYGRRFRARKQLQALGKEQMPWAERLLRDPSNRVRTGAAQCLGVLEGPEVVQLLIDALESERDHAVRQQMAQSLALQGPLPPQKQPRFTGEGEEVIRKLYLDRLLMVALEDRLHFDKIPGFFDGQFQILWGISEDVYDRLIRLAQDDACAFNIRVLAIMAMHEKRSEAMVGALRPLIMDPGVELIKEWKEFLTFRLTESLIEESRRRNLSKYARFSLAKAGFPQDNLAKIEEMKLWLQEHADRVFRPLLKDETGFGLSYDPEREFGKNIILDIAYNYIQFDHYQGAEEWYQRLIDKFSQDTTPGYVAEAHYNLACIYALTGKRDAALRSLENAIDKGFTDFAWMEIDKDLDSIRGDSTFKSLMDKALALPQSHDTLRK
jgi:hypothetical protein